VTAMAWRSIMARATLLVAIAAPSVVRAQPAADSAAPVQHRGATVRWLGGVASALVLHESGHALANLALGVPMTLERVEFHGIPFFSVTHGPGVTRREAYVISSAGFWVQHASSEFILTRHPRLHREHQPFAKGVMAFNTLLSVGYTASAFTRSGPAQRDPRSIAVGLGVSEPAVGAMILAPALLDAWRYYRPGHASLAWASRGVKVGLVVLTLR